MTFNSRSKLLGWVYPLVRQLGYSYILWVGRTVSWRIQGEENYFLERCQGGPIIFAFWHNQLMLMPFCYLALVRRKEVSALTSRSRDGQIVSDMLEKFGFDPIRGSSSRGGTSALLKLTRKLQGGSDLAITPDGPRGPRLRVQPGVLALASASGCPILPVAVDFRRKKVLKTWDLFKVPAPYAQGALVVGAPIRVDSKLDSKGLELKLKEVQGALDEVNRQAEELANSPCI